MPSRRFALFAVFVSLQSTAWAETCKYLDGEGRVIYSNTPTSPPKGATKVKCFEDPVSRPAQSGARNSESRPTDPDAKAKPPRVSENTQKTRDDERRRILEQELADESAQLAKAKEKLAEQEAIRTGGESNYQRFLDRVQPFRDAVATHERNLDAIRREVANLK